MKDNYARMQVEALQTKVKALEDILKDTLQGRIAYCPTCKHETVQKETYSDYRWCDTSSITLSLSGLIDPDKPKYYTCLNCGTKLKCTTERVCKAIEPKPKTKAIKPAKLKEKSQ